MLWIGNVRWINCRIFYLEIKLTLIRISKGENIGHIFLKLIVELLISLLKSEILFFPFFLFLEPGLS